MKVLITGSAGFAGRHLAAACADRGWDVTGIDSREGIDARDFFRSSDEKFGLVLHCAAIVGGRAMIDGAPLALTANLETDAACFQWALRTRPGRLVYFSSSAAYPVALQTGTPPRLLAEADIDLDDVRQPDQLYGWAKLTGEQLAARARGEGLAVSVVRPFSGFGEDQDRSYPFAVFAHRALQHEDPFTIWGTGAQVRDWVHIDDIVAAVLAMAEAGIDGPVNIGTGRPVPMTALAAMMAAAAGYEPQFRYYPDAPSGVAYRVADTTLLRTFYTPRISLEEGISRAAGPA